jgi:hypothetical protein
MEAQANEFFSNLTKIFNEETGKNYNAKDVWLDFEMDWLSSNSAPTAWKRLTVDHIHRAYKATFGPDELQKAFEAGRVFRNLSKVSDAFADSLIA